MKKFFMILAIGLLFSTPHTTHSRAIMRKIAAVIASIYATSSVIERHNQAIKENSKDPRFDAALTIPHLGGQALHLLAYYAEKAGVTIEQYVENARKELKAANTPLEKKDEDSKEESSDQK